MRVVVDTNVWVSALIAPRSKPADILQAVRERRVTAIASWHLAREVIRVVGRPKLRRYGITGDQVAKLLRLLVPLLPRVEVDVEAPVRDPADLMVISAAVAGGADAIVTGDRDFLEDAAIRAWLEARGIEVLTPAEIRPGGIAYSVMARLSSGPVKERRCL